MAATCMAVCKGSRKKIRGIFISSCHLPVAVECDIVILSEPGPIPQAPVGQFCRHNLSPRGDGNRKVFRFFSKMAMRHNLSPRGDGNCFIDSLIAAIMPGHNLSPRGDGNLLLLCSSVFAVEPDTTYPREGTETAAAHRAVKPCAGHNLSPRGDGNSDAATITSKWSDTTYPREGTETLRRIGRSSRVPRHNLSPRGDGNLI